MEKRKRNPFEFREGKEGKSPHREDDDLGGKGRARDLLVLGHKKRGKKEKKKLQTGPPVHPFGQGKKKTTKGGKKKKRNVCLQSCPKEKGGEEKDDPLRVRKGKRGVVLTCSLLSRGGGGGKKKKKRREAD